MTFYNLPFRVEASGAAGAVGIEVREVSRALQFLRVCTPMKLSILHTITLVGTQGHLCSGISVSRNLTRNSRMFEVSPPETTTQMFLKQKSLYCQPAAGCTGYLTKPCSPKPRPFSALSFTHKDSILVSTLQLARSGTTEAKKQG